MLILQKKVHNLRGENVNFTEKSAKFTENCVQNRKK